MGGVLGHAQFSFNISEVYSKTSTTVFASMYKSGGLLGVAIPENYTSMISNSYSTANIPGTSKNGGIIGVLCLFQPLSISYVYFSANITGGSQVGMVMGCVTGFSNVTLTTSNLLFFNTSISAVGFENVNVTVNGTALSCSSLWNTVNQSFSQSVWGGNRLKSEYQYSFGCCNCTSGCPAGCLVPSYSTQISSTQFQTSQISTTFIPSSPTLSSLFPTSQIYTTKAPPSQFPSSFPPSPSITTSSLAQTTIATTFTPFTCLYQVVNCQNCPLNAPLFDLTKGNLSCTFFVGVWSWTFTPNNGTFINTGEIVVSGNTTTFVEGNLENNAKLNVSSGSTVVITGNFTQTSGGQIVFTFNPQQNKSSPLNVGGCVSINGNISLNLQTQPQQGTTNFQVISYNCSQQVNISSSQIQVIPNYNGSSCDTINSQTINQPNSLGVSLTSTIGNKCNGGNNLGLIIGLVVGIPLRI